MKTKQISLFATDKMQAPTHILTGVLLQKLFDSKRHQTVAQIITALACYFSHGLLDKLAMATYHPPVADFSDVFWVLYHLAVLLITVLLLYVYGSEYKWAIALALLPDLDWVVVHSQHLFHFDIPFYNEPLLHNALHYIIDNTPGLQLLNNLPDYRELYSACIVEILLGLGILSAVKALAQRRRNIHF
ncbi:MAG: hypothetical protein IPN22_00265 [Bacteroidetes bacterium]|nr:hypothetical protein [Bacteroidota bacterium]